MKVGGDTGSTLNGNADAAYEWIIEHNEKCDRNDGETQMGCDGVLTPADKISALNMSFGSPDFYYTDPDTQTWMNKLVAAGCLPIISAGNSADYANVLTSSANTDSVLAVAAASSGNQVYGRVIGLNELAAGSQTTTAINGFDGIKLAGWYLPEYLSQPGNAADANYYGVYVCQPDDVTVTPGSTDAQTGKLTGGSVAFTPTALANMNGKYVVFPAGLGGVASAGFQDVVSDDATNDAANSLKTAGAKGILSVSVDLAAQRYTYHPDPTSEVYTGYNGALPFAIVSNEVGTALINKINTGVAAGSTYTMQLDPDNGFVQNYVSSLAGAMSMFSSRGGFYGDNATIKPDITSMGVDVISASSNTDPVTTQMSGTSMAAPFATGCAAVALQAAASNGMDLTAAQLKDMLMSTATHNVTTPGGAQTYSPFRAGTGRIDPSQACDKSVIAYNTSTPQCVSLSFGVVDVSDATASVTKSVTLQNLGTSAQTYNVSYNPIMSMPGVSYSVSPSSVSVAAQSTATVNVTLNCTRADMQHTLDPTYGINEMPSHMVESEGSPYENEAEASGTLDFVNTASAPDIRVAVAASPCPVSNTVATTNVVSGDGTTSDITGEISLSGSGVSENDDNPQAFRSMVAPMVLTSEGISPRLSNDERALFPLGYGQTYADSFDLQYVAASTTANLFSDPTQGSLNIAIKTYGNLPSIANAPSGSLFSIKIDSDEGTQMYLIAGDKDRNSLAVENVTNPSSAAANDALPVNGSSAYYTGQVNNSTIVATIPLNQLGFNLAGKSSCPIKISVQSTRIELAAYLAAHGVSTTGNFSSPISNRVIDEVDNVPFDLLSPDISFTPGTLNAVTSEVPTYPAVTPMATTSSSSSVAVSGEGSLTAMASGTQVTPLDSSSYTGFKPGADYTGVMTPIRGAFYDDGTGTIGYTARANTTSQILLLNSDAANSATLNGGTTSAGDAQVLTVNPSSAGGGGTIGGTGGGVSPAAPAVPSVAAINDIDGGSAPQTGDNVWQIAILAIMLVLTGAAILYTRKRLNKKTRTDKVIMQHAR
jgi:LPXTG-motif cell wall-anchored protein